MKRLLEAVPHWLKIVLIVAAVAVVAQGPLLYQWARTPEGWRYTGLTTLGYDDPSTYLATISQAERGTWFPKILHTTETQDHGFFSGFWVLLGKLAGLLNVSVLAVYMAATIGSLLLLAAAIDWLGALLSFTKNWRAALVAVAALAGGVGWIVGVARMLYPTAEFTRALIGTLNDFGYAGQSMTLDAAVSPHFVLTQALFVVGICLCLWRPRQRWLGLLLTFALGLVLGNIHPYDLVRLGAVYATIFFFDWKLGAQARAESLARFVCLLAGFVIPVCYFAWLVSAEPAYGSWAHQNLLPAPLPLALLLTYLPMIPLAIFGLGKLGPKKIYTDTRWRIAFVSLLVPLLCMYFPVRFQAHMLDGWYVLLAVWTVVGLQQWRSSRRAGMLVGLLCLLSLTPLARAVFLMQPATYPPIHQSPEVVAAEGYLEHQCASQPRAVLADEKFLDLYLPIYTGCAVYVGHHHLTMNDDAKVRAVEAFFYSPSASLEQRAAWLEQQKIDYLVVTRPELWTFSGDSIPSLSLVYRAGSVSVYQRR